MNDSEFKQYQKKLFRSMTAYIKDVVLPFEVIQKLSSPALIFIDNLILFIGIRQAIKNSVDSWPKDFNSEFMYCCYGLVLMNLSSEDREEFDRTFFNCSINERFRLWCLWITRERIRMVLGQRIEDAGYPILDKLWRELPQKTKEYSLTDKTLHIIAIQNLWLKFKNRRNKKENSLKHNAITRSLMHLDVKRDISLEILEMIRLHLDGFDIDNIQKNIMDINLVEKFREDFIPHTTQEKWNAFSENHKRWNRESWILFGINYLQTRFDLLPYLNITYEPAQKIYDNFRLEDKKEHDDRKTIITFNIGRLDRETDQKNLLEKIEFQEYLRQGSIPTQENDPVQREDQEEKEYTRILEQKEKMFIAFRYVGRTPEGAKRVKKAIQLRSQNQTWSEIAKSCGTDEKTCRSWQKRLRAYLDRKN